MGFFVAPPLTVPSDGAAGAAAGPAPRRKNDGIGFCHAPIVDGAIEEVAEGVSLGLEEITEWVSSSSSSPSPASVDGEDVLVLDSVAREDTAVLEDAAQ